MVMAVNEHHATIQELLVEIAVLKTKNDEREKALSIQALEYERRLDVLNHAHAEAQRVLNTYLPREIYDKGMDTLRLWQTSVTTQLDLAQGRNSTITAIGAALMAIAALGVSVWSALNPS
jgi:hypothetical protein